MSEQSSLPWYKNGLHFQCTGCGKCCTGSPGVVWITEEEMVAIATELNIPLSLFKRRYIRLLNGRYALVEIKTQNGAYDCVFLKNKKCMVYQHRPAQCKTYPWWKENLTHAKNWEETAKECEGIHDEAPLIPYTQIAQILDT